MSLELDRSGPAPIYQQIVEWMRQQVISGAWRRGLKLKAEVDLANEWGISRGTVRKAIAELIAEGLLTQTHGRGTFVTSPVVEQSLADHMITFSEDLISKGIPFETRVIDQAIALARGRVATLLSVPAGARIFQLRRLRLVNEAPLILLYNYVVYDYCPGIEIVDFSKFRLFQILEDCYSLKLRNGRRTFQAQSADRETANLLGIRQGDPVMYIEQVAFLDNMNVIEFSDLWLVGEHFRLTAEVQRPGARTMGLTISLAPRFSS